MTAPTRLILGFFLCVTCWSRHTFADNTSTSESPPLDLFIRGANPDFREVSRIGLGQEVDFGRSDIEGFRTAAADSFLKQVPGFSLFRRSPSITTNPTAQGVSLRGTGPSGAGRTVVLLDGIPLNDPFGGWISWGRVPMEGIDRVRIQQGWASNHWSYLGFAGNIELQTREPVSNSRSVTLAGGNRDTRKAHASIGKRTETLGISLGVESFSTDGYKSLSNEDRGAIDIDTDSHHNLGYGKIQFAPSSDVSAYFLWNGFSEGRSAGTNLTRNGTSIQTVASGGRINALEGGDFRFDLFGTFTEFESTFSSQSDDRQSETPASNQFDVPSYMSGLQADWATKVDDVWYLELGADAITRQGESNEDFRYVDGEFLRRRRAGASQEAMGSYVFARSKLASDFSLDGYARANVWRSRAIFREERELNNFAFDRYERSSNSWKMYPEYRLQAAWELTKEDTFRSALTYGSRIPTINEIARPFRVRNDVTEANPALVREKNVGIDLQYDRRLDPFETSFVLFANQLQDYIGNTTLQSSRDAPSFCGFLPEGGVCRQRQNIEEAIVLGTSVGSTVSLSKTISAHVAYLYTRSEVTHSSASPELENRDLIQLPRHQAVSQLRFADAEFRSMFQLKYVGSQFEDDLNTLKLAPYFTADASVSVPLVKGIDIFATAENLFGEIYEVSKSGDGSTGIGAPLLVITGVRGSY